MSNPTARSLKLPWPPTMNTYWRHVGRKVLISAEGRMYRQSVTLEVRAARVGICTGSLAVSIYAHPPAFDKRGRKHSQTTDLDNLLKPLLDALQHAGVYADDGAIESLSIHRRERTNPPSVLVDISEMTPARVAVAEAQVGAKLDVEA